MAQLSVETLVSHILTNGEFSIGSSDESVSMNVIPRFLPAFPAIERDTTVQSTYCTIPCMVGNAAEYMECSQMLSDMRYDASTATDVVRHRRKNQLRALP